MIEKTEEYIEYKGKKYKRNKNNYYISTDSNSNMSLHRAIYEDIYGKTKDGYVIHHIDENPLNNNINNLKAMTRSDHIKYHASNRSKETLDKLSKSGKGKHDHHGKNNPMYGKSSPNRKLVRCIETNIVYSSIKEASLKNNITGQNISAVCRGKIKTAGGYRWEYVYDNKTEDLWDDTITFGQDRED